MDMIRTESHPLPTPSSSRQSQNQTAVQNISLSSLILMMEAAAAAGFSDTPGSMYQSTNCNTPQVFIPYSFSK
jgi:hypothetical protein